MRIPTIRAGLRIEMGINNKVMGFGGELKLIRENAHLTQFEVAVQAGVSLSTVQKMEASDVPKSKRSSVRAVALAAGLRPEHFDEWWDYHTKQSRVTDEATIDVEVPIEVAEEIEREAAKHGLSVPEMIHVMRYAFEHLIDQPTRDRLLAEAKAIDEANTSDSSGNVEILPGSPAIMPVIPSTEAGPLPKRRSSKG